jgi:hypothetical protein
MQIMAFNEIQAASIIRKFLKIEKETGLFKDPYDAIIIQERKK